MSHWTHYRSYQGRVFTDQMTQPTVSKHWRKMFKDLASILPGPPHRVTIIQHICSKTIQCKKYINTRIYAQWNGLSETKPNPENCTNCSSKCAYDCAQLSVHNTAQNNSGNLPSYLQTIIIAQMLSIGGEGGEENREELRSWTVTYVTVHYHTQTLVISSLYMRQANW